jgi:tetratricopeptide (TPR) repeat protein
LVCCALIPARPAGAQAGNRLIQAGLGDGQGYYRLVFTFQAPLGPYTVGTAADGRVLVDLGPVRLGDIGALPRHEVITGLNFETKGGHLLALVKVGLKEYDLKHFTGRDRYTLNIDFLPPASLDAPAGPGELDRVTLAVPTLAEVALEQSRLSPPGPNDGPAEHLFQRILGEVGSNNRSAALDDLKFFLETFPDHPRLEVASYLKAELDFRAGPPEETYAAAVEGWKSFLDRWPHSSLSSRARYMRAEADRLLGLNNEAAGQFALLAQENDDAYARQSLLKAADLFMSLGMSEEARKLLTPVLNQGLADRLGWEVYARSGAVDFYQGFYNQAAEIMREALRQVPDIPQTFPEILYALGETYHYLGQPEMSRHYLTQAINLLPDHPKSDIILTRIGDNYRQEGLDREAIAIYGAVRRNYPLQEGGLISQVRLADMGSLHSFFSQEKVFDALERGSRQATVEMYKSIADAGFTSSLVQLAQLKIGLALVEDGAAGEAIKWLRDLEINNPKSPLLDEALPVLNAALVDEMLLRRDMGDWQGIVDLYADNSYFFAKGDRQRVESLVAQAYEQLGRYKEAQETWASLADETPDKRLVRARSLVVNSLKIGQPLEALKYILEMEHEFPDQRQWLDAQLAQTGQALARPHNAEAVTNLLDFRQSIAAEPARRDALSDAITIEIDNRRYDRAAAFIRQYRQEYPQDELSPEYLLTLAQIEDYQKRPDQAWDLQSQFRQTYPEDQRGRQILLDQVKKAYGLGRLEDAFRFIELFRGLYPRDPAGGALLVEKINRLRDTDRQDEARETLAAFIRDYPDDARRPEIMMDFVDRDIENGRYPEARELTEDLLEVYRGHPELLAFLQRQAERLWARGRHEEAQDLINLLLAAYPGEKSLASLLLRQAEQSWTQGLHVEARALIDLIQENYPGERGLADFLLRQAEQSWAQGRPEEARDLANLLLANYPGERGLADFLLRQADQSWTKGRPEEARDLAAMLLTNYPGEKGMADLMLRQAEQSWTKERYDEARNLTNLLMANYPGDARLADLLFRQADRHWTKGRYEEARELTNLLLNHYKGDERLVDLLLRQADQNWSKERYDEARNLTSLLLVNYPGDARLADLLLRQADQNWNKKRYDEAKELTDLLLANYPSDGRLADLLLRRAEGDWGRGRFEAALEGWSAFRRAFPENERIGWSYVDQYKKMVAGGLAAEAFKLAEEYRQLRPQDTAAQADLMLEQAKDHFALQQQNEGLAMWNRFRQAFPDDRRNADLLLLQARRELKSRHGAEALNHYKQFLAQYGQDERVADISLETAAAEVALNQRVEAWDRLNNYITTFTAHPGRSQAILDAVDLGRQLGRFPEAVALLELFRRDYPDSPSASATFLAEARFRLNIGDKAGAVTTLENGVLSRPDLDVDPQVQALLTELYLEADRVEDWAALVEKNLNRAGKGPASAELFQKYYQLAQVYQELGRNPDVERNLDSALSNRTGVSAENLYAVAQGYKRLARLDKYRATLLLVRDANDPFWQKIASDELAAGTSG